nr:reverse transcriptase domain-containing protein [Tanacetum cinerariifolium]
MVDDNIPAPAPTRFDDKILSFAAWVPIGKSKFVLDLYKRQKNLIFQISVDILQNTNFFRAFTASASVVYTKIIHFVSRMAVNNLYQPWRAILSMINQCLTDKTSGHDRPRYPTFLTDKANLGSPTKKGRKDKPCVILYCRFTKIVICHLGRIHNIHQRSASLFHLAEEDFRLGNLKFFPKGEIDGVFGMSIPNELISNNIRNAPYYNAYLEMVAKHDWKVAAEKERKKKTASAKQPKSKPAVEKSSKPAPATKPKATKERPSKASTAKPPNPFQLVDEPDEEPTHSEPEPKLEHEGEEATRPLPVVEGKGKAIATEEQVVHLLLALNTPKKRSTTGQFVLQRQTPVTEEASTGPSAQAQYNTSINIIRDLPSPADTKTETGVASKKTNSGGDTKILQFDEEEGTDVDDQVNLKEKMDELDQGQAGLDPGRFLDSRPLPEQVVMDEDQAGSDLGKSHGALAGPDAKPTHDEFMADLYPKDQFIDDKSTKDKPELAARVTLLEKKLSELEQTNKTLDNTSRNLGSRVFNLELRDLPHKIDEDVRKSIREVVYVALQASLRDCFRELLEANMKEILHQRMFESGSYKSLPEHVALYEALEVSMKRAERDNKRRRHDTGAFGSSHPQVPSHQHGRSNGYDKSGQNRSKTDKTGHGNEKSSRNRSRRNLGEPSSLFDFEEVMNNNHNQEPPPQNGPPPMVRPNGQAPGRWRSYVNLTQIDTFYNGLTLSHRDTINATAGGTFMQKTPEECYELIENMTAHYNHWDTSAIQDETSRNISSTSTTESPEVVRQLEMMNKEFSKMIRQIQTIKAVDTKCETCGGPHSFTECPATGGYNQETSYATTGNYNSGGTGSLPSNTVPNPQADLKVITTRSGVTLAGPSVSPLFSSKEVDREPEMITDQMPEVTKDTVQPSTENIQPPIAQIQIPIYEPVVAPKPKSTIPYPSRVNKQKLHEKDDNLALKFVEIFRNLHFELSFADALLHMPKLMFKNLLNNKEKLFDLAMTPVNENCSAIILKKLLEKLGDPGKFLIPCDFPEFDECLDLADLGVSINLMPLSIWKKLSLPELTSTKMILELADRSTTRPSGIAEDVFVKVGKFHFPTDFVVVDYVVDPCVPLIIGRPFLKTERALIDVYGEELTLRVDDEAKTFKVGQTSKYSYNDIESTNRVNVIDVACEEYVQEVLGFFDNSKSGNPTLISDPIIALSSPSLTPFEEGDFILEEIKACLTSESNPPGIDDTDLNMEGDIRLLEKLLNNDPSLSHLPPKELNVEEIKTVKSSIDEPPELELKQLTSHLEYDYLEGTDKLPVIISKGLKDDKKEALLKVLKSHKRAIAWKITDIK